MRKLLSFILLAAVLLLCACQMNPTKNVTTTTTTFPSSTSGTTTPSTSIQTADLPTQADKIESASEGIMDDIVNKDWTAAQNKVKDIQSNFSELKPKLVSASVSTDIIDGISSAIDGLASAVKAKTVYDSRVKANEVTKYIPDIYDYYTVTIPTDVSRLAYLDRAILLNAEKSDWTSASGNYDTANGLWNGLKSQLDAVYKSDGNTFQSTMDALKSAIVQKNKAETKNKANTLLKNVDTIKKDFTNQNKNVTNK